MPDPVRDWCRESLTAEPVRILFSWRRMSTVWGVQLSDDRRIVIKARPDPGGRVPTILKIQHVLAHRGFPCPLPVTVATAIEGWGTVHAETYLEAGEVELDDGTASAERFAALLARQVDLTRGLTLAPPLPNPHWVSWDHDGPELWPPGSSDPDHQPVREPDRRVIEAAIRARARVNRGPAPVSSFVVGHADWETQHIRWDQGVAVVVHDWDSLSWLPERFWPASVLARSPITRSPPCPRWPARLRSWRPTSGPLADGSVSTSSSSPGLHRSTSRPTTP